MFLFAPVAFWRGKPKVGWFFLNPYRLREFPRNRNRSKNEASDILPADNGAILHQILSEVRPPECVQNVLFSLLILRPAGEPAHQFLSLQTIRQ
ncbi:hypothetical protein D3C80_1039990 [compost metagenome]